MTGLADRLSEATYYEVFMASSAAQDLWAADGEAGARAVVACADATPAARLIAAELLAEHDALDLPPDVVAAVYVDGLRAGASGVGNVWGTPGGALGVLGRRVVRLGQAGVEPLRSALGDTTPVEFFGGREAAVGNAYAWRVRDVAATLLAQITGAAFTPDRDPAARDAAIDAL